MALVPETIMEDPDIAEWEKEPQRSFNNVCVSKETDRFATFEVFLDSFEQRHIAKAYFRKDKKFLKIAAKIDSKVYSQEFPDLTEEDIELPDKIETCSGYFTAKLFKKKDINIKQRLFKKKP